LPRPRSPVSPPRQGFPIRDRHTVSGHVVGDICFTCRCRVLEFVGDERIVFAWCECGFPDDAAEMEIL
jgi:hypothetical protein